MRMMFYAIIKFGHNADEIVKGITKYFSLFNSLNAKNLPKQKC